MQTHPPNPQTSINPPKSLLSLPKELMADICSQLDQKTAINMLYVHRSFHQPAESRIYRDITLSIPTYWGEPVLIRPEQYGSTKYIAWAKEQAKKVEMAGRAEARRRAEELIVALSTRGLERWRYIRKLVIEPRVEANNAIIQILSLARNYITEMEVIKARDHIYRDQWEPTRKETFWAKFADFGSVDEYTFPNLVKVSVSLEDSECSCLPELLLQRAPHLEHVELYGGTPTDYSHREPEGLDDYCDCPYQETPEREATHRSPPWEATLRVAHITCTAKEGYGCPPELAESIISSEKLKKLTIRVDDLVDEDGTAYEWLETMLHHPTLAHLDYDIPHMTIDEALESLAENTVEPRSSLKTLIYPGPHLQANHERIEKLDLSHHDLFTDLENLGLRTTAKASTRTAVKYSRFSPFDDHIRPVQPIPEDIAEKLMKMVKLDIIQFFPEGAASTFTPVRHWESKGTFGIVIRTLKHDNSAELLHTRTYSRAITQENPNPNQTESTYATSKYPQWEDATYYQGLVVPLSVLCEMKRVHGSSKPWIGRGIDVGKKAWQVLLGWKKENHPEEVADVAADDAAEVSRVIKVEDSEEEEE